MLKLESILSKCVKNEAKLCLVFTHLLFFFFFIPWWNLISVFLTGMSSLRDEISSWWKRVNSKRNFTINRDDFIPGWNFMCKHPLSSFSKYTKYLNWNYQIKLSGWATTILLITTKRLTKISNNFLNKFYSQTQFITMNSSNSICSRKLLLQDRNVILAMRNKLT